MTNRPIFQLPGADAPFLVSGEALFRYHDLYCYTEALERSLDTERAGPDNPLLVRDTADHRPVFTIAACWLLRIPFLPVPVGENPALNNAPGQLFDSVIEPDQIAEVPAAPQQKSPEHSGRHTDTFTSDPEGLLAVLSTSGSTGEPKLVPVRRRQLLSAMRTSPRQLSPSPGERWLLSLPLNHAGGINVILRSLLFGAAVHSCRPFKTDRIARLLEHEPSVVGASLVPTQLRRLLSLPDFSTHRDFHAILLGGGPVSGQLLEEAQLRDIPVVASYGMTETLGRIADTRYSRQLPKASSEQPADPKPSRTPGTGAADTPQTAAGESGGLVYHLAGENRMEIRRADGEIAGPGDEGVLRLQGPQLFDGYLEPDGFSPGKSWETGAEGENWFDTGDYARQVGPESFHLLSRRTDLILSGGENLIPVELEEALLDLNEVQQAAVTGLPDPEWGEIAVGLVVVRHAAGIDEEALKKKLRSLLPGYKIPKRILKVGELPRTSIGKLRRRELPSLARKALGERSE